MNLRDYARGQECQIRMPGCDGGGETTVLAHYRLAGYCGTGIKPDDLAFGAWACNNCHCIVDGRSGNDVDRAEARLAHAEGVMRTIAALRRRGIV